MTLIFDIETNGLYDDVSEIHCIGIHDTETSQTFTYNDQGDTEPIVRGLAYLEEASSLVGHNIIGYDIPVIRKLYPWFTPSGLVVDTLVLSRIYHADILKTDQKRRWKHMPLQLYGRHSLEAYGHRLGEYKGEFGKTADWKQWSPEMQAYMMQDVAVTTKLWKHFQRYLTSSN
jgi:uncharacterized protein YprB with RNaseH-like and TPR domain